MWLEIAFGYGAKLKTGALENTLTMPNFEQNARSRSANCQSSNEFADCQVTIAIILKHLRAISYFGRSS